MERAISVRLDEEAQRALAELMRSGRTQSQAIRAALLIASGREARERMRQEAAEVMADPNERAALAELRRDIFGEG